jgi:hypothetical protein
VERSFKVTDTGGEFVVSAGAWLTTVVNPTDGVSRK